MNPKNTDHQQGGANRQGQDSGMQPDREDKNEERTPTRQGQVGGVEEQEKEGQEKVNKPGQQKPEEIEEDLEE